jgi:hypothetical protein
MTNQHRLALTILTIVLVIQFVVPAALLFASGPNRWGWQMYSRESQRPEIVAVFPSGEREQVEFGDHVFHMRAELRVDSGVLRQLCERIPGVEQFELTNEATNEVAHYRCSD